MAQPSFIELIGTISSFLEFCIDRRLATQSVPQTLSRDPFPMLVLTLLKHQHRLLTGPELLIDPLTVFDERGFLQLPASNVKLNDRLLAACAHESAAVISHAARVL
ncbi:hypothetical protein BN2475_510049 [Paraburkholderia ribeironis]|uniref:Uncharacterized protein n=1 Tax=Paraburkholderia ribeironis TaxID=1247936 RepID=A0A1N7SC55_9BURK|nr:hypothetical protein BN2475_510049 [Paraburkholderia ribeironis]